MKADRSSYGADISYFRDFVRGTPAINGVIAGLELSEPGVDPDAWVATNFQWNGYSWPPTEVGRAKVCWRLVNRWADGEEAWQIAHQMSHESNINSSLRELTRAVVEPLVEYIQGALGSSSDILYLLEKYRRRVEWFEQERLFSAVQADSRRAEAIIDADLRQFLFDQGVDYPFSQPASVSGKADVVSGLESDDPLVCELKLFDGADKATPYLAQGINQAVAYARDYGKPIGYLVIANLTDERLEIEADSEKTDWPPRIQVGGVTIFVVVIDCKPQGVASKQRRTVRRVLRADLVRDAT
jgi:hypothetical protein